MKSVVFVKSSFNLLQSLSYNNEIYSEIADPIESRHPSEGLLSLRGKRFRASSSRKLGRGQKKGMTGEEEGREGNWLARKPHDFEKLRLPTNAAFDWCGAGSVH